MQMIRLEHKSIPQIKDLVYIIWKSGQAVIDLVSGASAAAEDFSLDTKHCRFDVRDKDTRCLEKLMASLMEVYGLSEAYQGVRFER